MSYNEVRGNLLKEFLVYLTSNCQLNCSHCFLPQIKPPKSLSLRDIKWTVETFKIKKVNLLGGEPLMHPKLEEIINTFDKETKITITTNGLMIANNNDHTKSLLNCVKARKNVSFQLSIQGNKQDTDAVRGEGVWGNVMKATNVLKENKIPCYFLSTFSRANLPHLEGLIDTVTHPLKIPLVLFPEIGQPQLSVREQTWLFSMIVRKNSEYNANNLVDLPHFYQWLGLLGRCGAGSERLCLTYNKEFTPCHFDFDYILGRVGDSLQTINRNRQFFIDNNKRIQSNCNYCKNADICRSSCSASGSYVGCPLQADYTLKEYASSHSISDMSLATQVKNIRGLLRESLICG